MPPQATFQPKNVSEARFKERDSEGELGEVEKSINVPMHRLLGYRITLIIRKAESHPRSRSDISRTEAR